MMRGQVMWHVYHLPTTMMGYIYIYNDGAYYDTGYIYILYIYTHRFIVLLYRKPVSGIDVINVKKRH